MSTLDAAVRRAGALADAVLREGQVLFPYRASALKNRYRWQWGVVAPPEWVDVTGSDRAAVRVECIADVRVGATVSARVRFFHLETRLDSPEVSSAWDEGLERHVDVGPVEVAAPTGTSDTATTVVSLEGSTGAAPGTEGPERRRRPVRGAAALTVTPLYDPWSLTRVSLVVRNETSWTHGATDRDQALRSSLVGVHAILAVSEGTFVSAVDPPDFARAAVADCTSEGLWPCLLGPVGLGSAVIAAPMILPDHARVAEAGAGDSCDATEIDELLALSVRALGEDEKREARATDPVAAAVLDRYGMAGPGRLGAMHASAPRPEAVVVVGGIRVTPGARVRLRPALGGDAQDAFVDGHTAVVEDVLQDVDGTWYVAVTIEGDPGAELDRWRGRFRYFRSHEIEPVSES